MCRQDDATRLLALALLNYADDHGYFYAEPSAVRSFARPFDDDLTMIRRSIAQLSKIGFIEVREHPEIGPIGRVVKFTSHQRVDRPNPSKIKDHFDSTNNLRTFDDDSTLERKGREQGKERKGKDKNICVELDFAAAIELLPLNDGSEFPVNKADSEEWQRLYAAVNVPQELKAMRGWLMADKKRQKTLRGIRRFANGWLTRAQDRGRNGWAATNGAGLEGKQAVGNGGAGEAKSYADPNCPRCTGSGWDCTSGKALRCACFKKNREADTANPANVGRGAERTS